MLCLYISILEMFLISLNGESHKVTLLLINNQDESPRQIVTEILVFALQAINLHATLCNYIADDKISIQGIRKALESTLTFDYVSVIPLRNHHSLEKIRSE